MVEIKLWDLASGTEVLSLEKPHRPLRMAISPKGEFLVSVGRRATTEVGEIKIWDLKSGQLLHQFVEGVPREHPAVGFSPDGRTAYALLGAKVTQQLGIIDVASGRIGHMQLPQKLDKATAAAFSPTNDTAAIAVVQAKKDGRCAIDIHELRQRRMKHSIRTETTVFELVFSADGTLLAGSVGGMITLWRTSDWSQLAQLPGRVSIHERIAASPDGAYVAALSREGVDLVDVVAGTVRQVGLAVRCLDLGFSSGGTLMIVPENARVMYFDPATCKEQLVPKLRVRS